MIHSAPMLLEVGQQLPVALVDLRRVQARVVDELRHDEVGLHREHLLPVVVRAARRLGEVAVRVAPAPGLGQQLDVAPAENAP